MSKKSDCCGVPEGVMCREDCERRKAWEATRCGARALPGQTMIALLTGEEVPAVGSEVCVHEKGCQGPHVDGTRLTCSWTEPATFVLCSTCGERVGADPLFVFERVSRTRTERRVLCEACEPSTASRRAIDRLSHESPLVALVNAVPEGLDPVGWRAAVLFLYEDAVPGGHDERLRRWPEWSKAPLATLIAVVRGEAALREPVITIGEEAALVYRRALAFTPKVQPYQRRSAGLPLDLD